ncbi:MAG TPA: amidase [Gammaproteobacteria bacterium]|jgi:aspartyl-tRNA(Asn)/glutamyl-tRNA(Gln) amidotransferase subunit A
MHATRRELMQVGLATGMALAAPRVLAQATDPTELTLTEASTLLRTRAISPVELVQAYLERIERLEPQVNSYITVTAALALEQARLHETELVAGRWRGPLHGVPIALKDNIDTAGIRTTAASAVLAERVPTADAEVYRRLKDAGAVLLGKLNMHEFAYGGTSAITHFGPVRNPWSLEHIPGGSSGGSAAAVAARLCAAALGTDTLASIRLPAAYCGIVGFKPTHGLSSIRGIIPVSESLDHVGPMSRTVVDAALVLDAIAGYDSLDSVSIRADLPRYAGAGYESATRLRIGIPRAPYYADLDPDVGAAIEEALRVLRTLAGGTRDVTLPEPPSFVPLLAESYAYHEQYLADPANHELYDPLTLSRIIAAGEVPVEDYVNARNELALVRASIADVFRDVDLLVTPTTPSLPELISNPQNPNVPSGAEVSVRNTAPFNLYGIPTISVPCGFSRSGLPIGLQISGPRLSEVSVLALAHAYEQATEWHRRRPPL